jgi:hypothetical protein
MWANTPTFHQRFRRSGTSKIHGYFDAVHAAFVHIMYANGSEQSQMMGYERNVTGSTTLGSPCARYRWHELTRLRWFSTWLAPRLARGSSIDMARASRAHRPQLGGRWNGDDSELPGVRRATSQHIHTTHARPARPGGQGSARQLLRRVLSVF